MKSETQGQLALLLNALERDFYHPLCSIEFSGFPTAEMLTPDEAARHERQPMPQGTRWGDAWQYCWLFASLTLPDEARGERIVLNLNPGGESTVFLNGEPFGTRRAEWVRVPHHYLVDQAITHCAQSGEHFSLMLEVYGGTPLPEAPLGRCATGPVFPEEGVRMAPLPPAVVGSNTLGIWNEEAYQLWLDVSMLLDLHDTQPDDSFWREKINFTLCQLLNQLDLEQPLAQRRNACRAARALLSPLMAARNGSFAPQMSAIANSHLDVAWLWPLDETVRKVARTFAQQLRLLEEYPEARYLQSQAILYEMCRIHYPDLFEKIRQAVRRGQWVVDGAMWVEPDTNLAGGEALIRQILYGKQFFAQHFGADCQVAWLPDSFGYSAALPQIMNKCGITGLTTQKIFWTYNNAEPFPYHAFHWQGLDGSITNCYLHMQYESFVDAKTLNERWKSRLHQDGTGEFYLPFGYGDGGGGPTRDDYEQIRREADLQGVPKIRYEAPAEFFARRSGLSLPTYRGEMYFQCHRGTYTTQAAIKRGNRQCEQAIRALELWAACGPRHAYPAESIREWWKSILLNQFHDILPGSAIARACAEARALHARTLHTLNEATSAALSALIPAGSGITLMNAQSAPVTRVVELDERFSRGVQTAEGVRLPYTPCGKTTLALVPLPAMGCLSVLPAEEAAHDVPVRAAEMPEGFELSNGLIRVRIDRAGRLLSLKDETDGTERIAAPSNCFRFYRDLPRAYDAWDIDSQTAERPLAPEDQVQAAVVLREGVRASVKITHRLLSSVIEQTISLEADQRRVDFDTTVDWHERHKLLKVTFDTGICVPEAANQIQFGYIMRPTHASRPMDADRFEVCQHGYTALFDATHGAAVLNDCKYGVSMQGSTIQLSLLRGATHPDPDADQGLHRFAYAYMVWDGPFQQSGIVHEAGKLNIPVLQTPGTAPAHSFFQVDDPAVVIEAVKQAEDGSGDLILRLYESMNGQRSVHLQTCFPVQSARLCSMLEESQTPLHLESSGIRLSFRPFEILTLRLSINNETV